VSIEHVKRTFRTMAPKPLGQTYGRVGRAPYGPTAPAGWTGPRLATGHGTQRPGAAVTLGGFHR